MSPTSLNRPIVEKGCIYNLSLCVVCVCVCVCVCVWSTGPFSKSKPYCDLENGVKVTKI